MSAQAPHAGLSRRNFILGLVNGSIFILMAAFIDVDTIVSGFAWQLTGGKAVWVGVLISLINSGWFWPLLFLTPLLATKKRFMPWYWLSAISRSLGLIALMLVTWHLDRMSPHLAFALIAGMFLVYSSGGGVSLIPFMSVVSDTIPPNWRGKFFGGRYLIGGLLAFGAGFFIKWMLSDRSPYEFPDNYALLFTIAAILGVFSLFAWCFAYEPEQSAQSRRFTVGTEMLRGWRLLRRDRNFRRLISLRCIWATLLGLTSPFLVPYALSRLGAVPAVVGLLLALKVLTYSLSNLLWSRVSDQIGNRRLIVASAWLCLATMLMVLAVRFLPPTYVVTVVGLRLTYQTLLLCLIFACLGFAAAGQEIGQSNFLLELSPLRKRPTYLGFYFLVLLPLCWVPFVGSLLIGQTGRFLTGFTISALLAAGMAFYSLHLKEVRVDECEEDGSA
jgi:MFS family permease